MMFAEIPEIVALLGAFGTFVAVVTAAAVKFLPEWTKTRTTLRAQAAEQETAKAAQAANLKREARHQMRNEYGILINRLNVDIKARDTIIERHGEELNAIRDELQTTQEAHTRCLMDNERLRFRLALVQIKSERGGLLAGVSSDDPSIVQEAERLADEWSKDAVAGKGIVAVPGAAGGTIVAVPPGAKAHVDMPGAPGAAIDINGHDEPKEKEGGP